LAFRGGLRKPEKFTISAMTSIGKSGGDLFYLAYEKEVMRIRRNNIRAPDRQRFLKAEY
jgi:hypothetical protein